MIAIIVLFLYGNRYEIPIFTVEQANAYLKEFNGDNGICHLYTIKYSDPPLKAMAEKVLDDYESFIKFITSQREEWVDFITNSDVPRLYHTIRDFHLESIFTY